MCDVTWIKGRYAVVVDDDDNDDKHGNKKRVLAYLHNLLVVVLCRYNQNSIPVLIDGVH